MSPGKWRCHQVRLPQVFTVQQQAHQRGDQQIGEVAMRKHLDDVPNLFALTRRIAHAGQTLRNGRRL
jgi:hypothetical protein